MELLLQEQQSKGFEDATDFVFKCGNIFLHCQPDFFDVDTKVVVNLPVTHPGNALPWDLDIFRSCLFRNGFCRLTDDFDLQMTDSWITVSLRNGGLPTRLTQAGIFAMASRICLR